MNGTNRSPRDAVTRLTTLAPAPTITNIQGLAGAIAVVWSGTDASEYVVELELPSGEIREVARTPYTVFEIGGLEGSTSFRVRVSSVNRTGHASAPSAWASVVTQAVTTIYAAPSGSDAGDGSVSAPVATLGRAIQLAASNEAQVIELASGLYTQATPLVLDFPVTIRGAGVGATVSVQSLALAAATGASCGSSNFTPRTTYAAMRVTSSGSLYLENVDLRATEAVSRDACSVALDFAGAQLHLVSAELGVDNDGATDVPCAMGLLARGAENVSLFDSRVLGFSQSDMVTSPNLEAAAMCVSGANTSVQITSSSLSPLGGGPHPSGGLRRVYGLITDVDALRISRSRIGTHASSLSQDVGNASVAALNARVKSSLNADNSTFLTPSGGVRNDAIRVEAATSSPILTRLTHVTASVGGDWGDTRQVAAGHNGAALRIVGDVDHLEIVNSLLNHAGGHSPTGVAAAINLEEAAPICGVYVRGNAMAVPARPFGDGERALLMRDSTALEFGSTNQPNDTGLYGDGACGEGAQANQNLAMLNLPDPVDRPDIVPAIETFGYPIALFAGSSTLTASRDALLDGGLPLSTPGLPAYTVIGTDVAGEARPMSGAPSIGAYTRR